jgi:hypothetical protein
MAFMPPESACAAGTETGRPEWAVLLSNLNLTALNLANNHFQFDAGVCGIEKSLEILHETKINTFGIGKNFRVITKNHIKIGMLGYARYTMNSDMLPKKFRIGDLDDRSIFEDIKKFLPLVDHLVISIHWGEALIEIPNPKEEDLAKKMLAAGASLIIGTGPHVLQKIGIYKNGVVAYSMGNYIFDPLDPPQANFLSKKSSILQVEFSKSSIESVLLFPIFSSSGFVSIPAMNEISAFEDHLNNLYQYTESDFYNRYPLWKRISGRLRMVWEDMSHDPRGAIKKHFKVVYFQRALHVIWQKYKYILLLMCSATIFFGILFYRLRRKNALKFK